MSIADHEAVLVGSFVVSTVLEVVLVPVEVYRVAVSSGREKVARNIGVNMLQVSVELS